jgi:hypothetical protein
MAASPIDDRERYEWARRRVRELRAFYMHLIVFVGVNILLHVINFATSPRAYWAFWPLFGWGIGLVAHALATYRWMPFAGKEWEERKSASCWRRITARAERLPIQGAASGRGSGRSPARQAVCARTVSRTSQSSACKSASIWSIDLP